MARRGKVIRFPGPAGQATPAPDGPALVELCRCDQPEAMVVKSLLDSESIPAVLRSRLAHSVHPFTVGAQGEVTVLVPREELARSQRLIS
jgi:flagella basal body P-ring formation protein FlgA